MSKDYKTAEFYLEQTDPLWFNLIDLDKLDMSNGEFCVFGQVQGAYTLYGDTNNYSEFCANNGITYEEEVRIGVISPRNRYNTIQKRWYSRVKTLQAKYKKEHPNES